MFLFKTVLVWSEYLITYFYLSDSFSNKQVTPSSPYNVKGECFYHIAEPYVLLLCRVQFTEIYHRSWNWRLYSHVELDFCRFFEIFEKYDGYKYGHVKLKRPKQLQEILDIARSLLNEIQHRAADPEIEEKQGKLEQLKSVLEMWVFTKLLYTEVEKETNSDQK